jgi:ComF family protein
MSFAENLLGILYPPRCIACDASRPGPGGFCATCAISLTPLHDTAADAPAGGVRVLSTDAYGAALADAIVRMKHVGRPEIAKLLAARIAARWPAPPVSPAVLVPVPLHLRDLRVRGYNQAALLAGHLAGSWRLPYRDVMLRIRRSGSQRGRSPMGRREAVDGAFGIRRGALSRLGGKPVILIDDVVTTGATIRETARLLRAEGAMVAAAVVAARAL